MIFVSIYNFNFLFFHNKTSLIAKTQEIFSKFLICIIIKLSYVLYLETILPFVKS